MSTDFVVVLCTVPEPRVGAEIARILVGRRLAACVNVVPGLTSIYRWKGEIHEDAEALMVIKTRRQNVGALEQAIRSSHPYSVPEVVALPIGAGSAEYLSWLWTETTREPD
ncbi:MAG: divalent-cation tolerance protein CutA [Deltaproteobacteria bacterium]|nr:divalent-cation tolerance protein CutA [Deltaproteobacteria bacterium]